ncbi:uncharacterized protein LOC129566540 [Sitodiplosis mosellana]|uniref:uncharacterized protein LOC129566540 n=1 Tax=Sitodiplosis mosellana TaxID=263140 RepID=UPI002444E891|nr:uncharacterized protein LOC129566540 [Sitodiplosis mosellana]
MSDDRIDVEGNTRSNMENMASPSQIKNVTPDLSDDRLSSPILMLDVDGLEELFEWLSLVDLRSLRQTCKRLKQVIDYFIKTNYPAVRIGFRCIMPGVCIGDEFHQIQQLDPISVNMIKKVRFCVNIITHKCINSLRQILSHVEHIENNAIEVDGDFYESILKGCSSLKYLYVNDEMVVGKNGWLCRQYPTIEHFAIGEDEPGSSEKFTMVKTFFELNPNIQTFSTSSYLLQVNRNYFLGSNIKIDRLKIRESSYPLETMIELRDILNQLYDQGSYKRLHLFIEYVSDQTNLIRISSTRGMEKLYVHYAAVIAELTLPPMPDLRELCLSRDELFQNFESIAKNLMNVERVYVEKARIEDIVTFVHFAPKIKEIKVRWIQDGTNFKDGVIDLPALNKERKRLPGACKVTVYVKENIFLSTKWATAKTELSLVRLKRTAAVDWVHRFE